MPVVVSHHKCAGAKNWGRTRETLAFFDTHGIPFERAREARQQASHAHNLEETPNFAKSIERKALSRG